MKLYGCNEILICYKNVNDTMDYSNCLPCDCDSRDASDNIKNGTRRSDQARPPYHKKSVAYHMGWIPAQTTFQRPTARV